MTKSQPTTGGLCHVNYTTGGDENNQECESRISKFFSSYKIGDLLRKCGAGKEKGMQSFRYSAIRCA